MNDRADRLRIATALRVHREERLRSLGFKDPTDDDRRRNLALNVALLDWPRTA
jgi:hypothetical protein